MCRNLLCFLEMLNLKLTVVFVDFFLESDRVLYIYSQTNCICSSHMLISLLPILFTCAHLKTDCAVLHVLIWKLTVLFALPVY